MKRKKRNLIVVLCVIVGVVLIASVVLRLVLTRERLIALIVPRVEKAVRAEIQIGDIGISFPFGFGVDVRDLAFRKALPDGGDLSFASEKVVFRASLLSLIRRRPEIKKIEARGGTLTMAGIPRGLDVLLGGVEAGMSLHPVESGYSINASVAIDSISFTRGGRRIEAALERIRFDGVLESDKNFSRIKLDESTVRWNDLVTARLTGEVRDLKTKQDISLQVESPDNRLAPVVDKILSFPLHEIVPALKGKKLDRGLPVNVKEGRFGFDSKIDGSMKNPSTLQVSGALKLNDLVITHAVLEEPVSMNGSFTFSDRGAQSEGLSVRFGDSKGDLSVGITLSDGKGVQHVQFGGDLDLAIEDLTSLSQTAEVTATGKVRATVKGGAPPDVLANLFPSQVKSVTPEQIARAWQHMTLNGDVEIEGANFSTEGSPFRVTGLKGRANIDGGNVERVIAEFSLNGSPFTCNASLTGIMPAMAELASLAPKQAKDKAASPYPDPGRVLDGMKNVPVYAVELTGRSLDVRPFEKTAPGIGDQQEGAGAEKPDETGTVVSPQPLAGNPIMLLSLKNTSFTAQLDSVISSKAIFTTVHAKGTIRDGRLKADPVTLDYAGGKGRAVLNSDLRTPGRVRTRVNVSFDGVEAGKALGRLHSLGNLVRGVFTFESHADFESGPGINPLMTVSATGSASSSMGNVSISPFIASLREAVPFDLSPIERFDFSEWYGNFIVREGRFITEGWKITSPKGEWTIQGSFGFDGTLDYAVNLVIPPAVQQEMKDLGKYRDVVDLIRDREGNLVLDLHLGGIAKSPRVSLDLSKAKSKATDKVIDSVRKKLRDYLKK